MNSIYSENETMRFIAKQDCPCNDIEWAIDYEKKIREVIDAEQKHGNIICLQNSFYAFFDVFLLGVSYGIRKERYQKKAKAIGKNLREARGTVPRREVAKAIGIPSRILKLYEQGDSVPKDEIKAKISQYYNLPTVELFNE